MTGLSFVKPHFDVALVAQLAQPLLVGLVGLALAQHLPRLQPAALGASFALEEAARERWQDDVLSAELISAVGALRRTPLGFPVVPEV